MSDVNVPAPAGDVSNAPVDDVNPIDNEVIDDVIDEDAELEAAKPKEEPKPRKKKYAPKVNGKQKEIEIDLDNDEEVVKYLSKALAADEKFQEAAHLRKNVEMLVNELKTNPRSVLSHPELGLDLKKFAQDILNEEIEEMQKTPEQKELEKLRKELEAKTKREQELEDAKRVAEMERLEEQAFKQFDDDVTEALSSTSLPKSPYVIKRIADIMIEAVNKGYTDVGVKDIMPIVENQIKGELQKMFEIMPEEVMEEMIGKNNLSRLRKKRLAQMKKAPTDTVKNIKETGVKKDSRKPEDEKPLRFNDLFGKF